MNAQPKFKNLLYIRSYLSSSCEGHSHDFNQLIISLTAYLDTGVEDKTVCIHYG